MFDFSTVNNFLGDNYLSNTEVFFKITNEPWFIFKFEELFSKNIEWANRSANEQTFFILDYGKYPVNRDYKVSLKLVGIQEVPTISITLPYGYGRII